MCVSMYQEEEGKGKKNENLTHKITTIKAAKKTTTKKVEETLPSKISVVPDCVPNQRNPFSVY